MSNIGSSFPCARSLSAPICCLSSPAWVRRARTARRLGQGQKLWDAVVVPVKTEVHARVYVCVYGHVRVCIHVYVFLFLLISIPIISTQWGPAFANKNLVFPG